MHPWNSELDEFHIRVSVGSADLDFPAANSLAFDTPGLSDRSRPSLKQRGQRAGHCCRMPTCPSTMTKLHRNAVLCALSPSLAPRSLMSMTLVDGGCRKIMQRLHLGGSPRHSGLHSPSRMLSVGKVQSFPPSSGQNHCTLEHSFWG